MGTSNKTKDLEKEVRLPYVLKDKVLFAPGIWNNNLYSEDQVQLAFQQTDWESKDMRSLFLDHLDENVPDWVGLVENPNLREDGTILGDLHIVDKDLAMKLHFGAKFGISPKVVGLEEDGSMQSFTFENWSVVITPACKLTYINNKESNILDVRKNNKEDNKMSKVDEALIKLDEEPVEAEEVEAVEEPEDKPKGEVAEEDDSVEALMESLSEDKLSEFTNFMLKGKKEGHALNEIVKGWKAKENLMESYTSMSKENLKEIMATCSKLLEEEEEAKPKEEPKVEVDVAKLKEQVKKELMAELKEDEPERVATKELSVSAKPKYDNPMEAMLELVKGGGQGTFSL